MDSNPNTSMSAPAPTRKRAAKSTGRASKSTKKQHRSFDDEDDNDDDIGNAYATDDEWSDDDDDEKDDDDDDDYGEEEEEEEEDEEDNESNHGKNADDDDDDDDNASEGGIEDIRGKERKPSEPSTLLTDSIMSPTITIVRADGTTGKESKKCLIHGGLVFNSKETGLEKVTPQTMACICIDRRYIHAIAVSNADRTAIQYHEMSVAQEQKMIGNAIRKETKMTKIEYKTFITEQRKFEEKDPIDTMQDTLPRKYGSVFPIYLLPGKERKRPFIVSSAFIDAKTVNKEVVPKTKPPKGKKELDSAPHLRVTSEHSVVLNKSAPPKKSKEHSNIMDRIRSKSGALFKPPVPPTPSPKEPVHTPIDEQMPSPVHDVLDSVVDKPTPVPAPVPVAPPPVPVPVPPVPPVAEITTIPRRGGIVICINGVSADVFDKIMSLMEN